MSGGVRRDWVRSYREQEQAQQMALLELQDHLSHLMIHERKHIIWLCRWYEKWHLAAGWRKVGRLLLDVARIAGEELPHG